MYRTIILNQGSERDNNVINEMSSIEPALMWRNVTCHFTVSWLRLCVASQSRSLQNIQFHLLLISRYHLISRIFCFFYYWTWYYLAWIKNFLVRVMRIKIVLFIIQFLALLWILEKFSIDLFTNKISCIFRWIQIVIDLKNVLVLKSLCWNFYENFFMKFFNYFQLMENL